MEQAAISEVVDAIRAYLAKYPHASDSLEGVQRWWLSGREASQAVLSAALERLVLDGVMESRRLPDGSWLYATRTRPPHE